MRTIAESIKRLYETGKLTADQVSERLTKGTITQAEYEEIIGK